MNFFFTQTVSIHGTDSSVSFTDRFEFPFIFSLNLYGLSPLILNIMCVINLHRKDDPRKLIFFCSPSH